MRSVASSAVSAASWLVMGTGLWVRVTQVRVRVTKLLPVTFPYPFGQVMGM